jgi:hypothetical protein
VIHRADPFPMAGLAMKLAAYALLVMTVSIPTVGRAQTPALLLYGGGDHQTFLGCVNCSQFVADSICNQFGQFGSEFQTSTE